MATKLQYKIDKFIKFDLLKMFMGAKDILKDLTGKKYIYLTKDGNSAIKKALKLVGEKLVLIQDQGGWITYKQYPKRIVELKTDKGIIELKDLMKNANADSVLLVNSLSGYFAEQPMKEIIEICKKKKCLVINDISGSIGSELSKHGDIVVCSFGRWKPVALEYGGFIGSDFPLDVEDDFDKSKLDELSKRLEELPKRLKNLHKGVEEVKKDLKDFDIIYRESKGLNVVVKYNDEEEKNKIIKYCDERGFEWVLCPKYIKVNEKAVSIEVKRK